MENEEYIESGLSVGAVKYVDPNEIITEAEYNYIKNKVPELDGRVGVIENEIEEINSSLDDKVSNNDFDIVKEQVDKSIKYDNIINNNGIGIQVNKENIINKDIINKNIECTSFGILINEKTKNSKNIRISDNNVKTLHSDGIEINTPSDFSDGKEVLKDVLISNNFISNGDGSTSTGTSSGFGVGVAQTKNVVISNNISEHSRNEGLHIEGNQESVTSVGNVFDNNVNDGFRYLYKKRSDEKYSKGITVIGNHFKKKDNLKTNSGFRRISDSNGCGIGTFTSNRIEGFANGIELSGPRPFLIDNNIIENCSTGVMLGEKASGKGIILTHNVNTLVNFGDNSNIDGVITDSSLNVDDIFNTSRLSKGFGTINQFQYNLENISTTGDVKTYYINLLKLPTYAKGTLQVLANLGNYYRNIVFDITIKNGELTSERLGLKNSGTIGEGTLSIRDGYLCIYYYTVTVSTLKINVKFDGVCIY